MCGRYILTQKIETIAKRYNVGLLDDTVYAPSYNISPGNRALVFVNDDVPRLRSFIFGLTPFWAKKPMYLFNARSEGSRNKDNNPNYSGAIDIINKPAFRKAIRSQRCLVPADAFIEGTINEGLNRPYLVYLRGKVRPFSLAGIWDKWQNHDTGEELYSFSIVTTVANSLLQQIPHHRIPVIINLWDEAAWISKQTPLSRITSMLHSFDSNLMNAYPISAEIKNIHNNHRQLIEPIGARLMPEDTFCVSDKIAKRGFGRRKIH